MEVVLFRIHPRENIDVVEYENAFNRMVELVSEIPGFLGIEGFTGEDGSELAVARFDSPDAIARWRDHPEHIRTRERGREEFFASYEITIATTWKQYGWNAADREIRVTEDLSSQQLLGS